MLITFKTLQQKTFKIEADETETVKALKEKIASDKPNEFPLEGIKLIYAGKILDDEKQIKEYNIVEKNFVVIMAVKAKPKTTDKPKDSSEVPPVSSATVTEPQSTTASSVEVVTTAVSVTTQESTTSTTSTTSASSVGAAESNLLTGSALETSITELMSLGFNRDQVVNALNSSFHNADRAAEYLLSGNVPNIGEGDLTAASGDEESSSTTISDQPTSGVQPPSGDELAFLTSLPQFQLMRNQLRQNPSMLPQLLQEIGQANPQLLQLISQNQQRFIDLLNSPDDASNTANAAAGGGGGGVQGSQSVGGGQGGGGGGGESPFQIQVTPDEKSAIDRIVAMGFPEAEVVQAFFACEKNEQLTINFLLSQ